MASDVDICNLALARLGDSATVASIDPPEGSTQAEHCARFYSVARNTLLELHDWSFATRRKALALTAESSWGWSFAYASPSEALRIVAVLPALVNAVAASQPYEIESGGSTNLILTNQDDAVARYTALVTDTTRFPPLFVEALSWLLASYLAGPLIKGDAGAAMARSCYQSFMLVLGQAKVSDASQRSITPEHIPAWIGGR